MKQAWLIVLLLMSSPVGPSPSLASQTVVDGEFISPRSLLLFADLKRVDRVDEIPCGVRDALFDLWADSLPHPPGIANPGEPWQCCCTVSSDGLPRRRLVFAAGSPNLWAVYFEQSGRSVERHFITFAVYSSGQAEPMESLIFAEPLKSVADIKRLASVAKTRSEAGLAIKW